MKNLFFSLTRKQFAKIASALCLAGDLFVFLWILNKFGSKEKINQIFNLAFSVSSISPEMIDTTLLDQTINRFITTLWIGLAAILVFHLINYTTLIKEKTSLIGYLKLYSFSGAIGFSFFGIDCLFRGSLLLSLSGLFGVTYLWVGLGLVYFFNKKKT